MICIADCLAFSFRPQRLFVRCEPFEQSNQRQRLAAIRSLSAYDAVRFRRQSSWKYASIYCSMCIDDKYAERKIVHIRLVLVDFRGADDADRFILFDLALVGSLRPKNIHKEFTT